LTVHTIPENFLRGLFDERPTMENHSCRRGEEEERVGEDGVRNGGVWKAIYREGGSNNGWKAINVVKKRGKTRFFNCLFILCSFYLCYVPLFYYFLRHSQRK